MESGSPLEKELVMAKIVEYENFVNLTLQPKIKHFENLKAELRDEMEEYVKFNNISKDIDKLAAGQKYESLVDIGQGCFVQSEVAAPKEGVYVHVGLGFFLELTWPDAAKLSKEREKILQTKISQAQDAIDRVQSDMDEAIEANAQLKKITLSM